MLHIASILLHFTVVPWGQDKISIKPNGPHISGVLGDNVTRPTRSSGRRVQSLTEEENRPLRRLQTGSTPIVYASLCIFKQSSMLNTCCLILHNSGMSDSQTLV